MEGTIYIYMGALVVMFPQRMWCKFKNIFNLEMTSLKVRTVSMNAHESKYQQKTGGPLPFIQPR